MSFDESQYVQNFVKKLRRSQVLPDDLLSRYDITLPATDTEITEQVMAVRAYWSKTYQGSSTSAQVARMCRAADERLHAEHGTAMLMRAWWEARQVEHRAAVSASIDALAQELRQRYGHLGIVTIGIAERFASKLGLSPSETVRAAQRAEVALIEGVVLPESEPIPNFSTLLRSMSECAAPSVPELIYPGGAPFSLVHEYISPDRGRRLDLVAVDRQITALDKHGVSITDVARRSALTLLRGAMRDGADLREIALYHLVTMGQELMPLSPGIVAEKLQKTGLSRTDAAVVAVVLDERNMPGGAGGPEGTRKAEWLTAMARAGDSKHNARKQPVPATVTSLPLSLPSVSPVPIAALQVLNDSSGVAKAPVAAITLVPEWNTDTPVDTPTIQRRVQLGIPTTLPITQSELESDKHLANAISSRKDLYFCLIRITPTFHEGRGGTIVQAYVEVKLQVRESSSTHPKVWSMTPEVVEEKTGRSRQVSGSGGTGPGRANIAFDSSYDKHEPFITAYGLQSSSAYWKFTRTRGREIRGSHTLEMVICVPYGYTAEAIIAIYGMTRKRRYGLVPIRSSTEDDSCRITLPPGAIQQVPMLPQQEMGQMQPPL